MPHRDRASVLDANLTARYKSLAPMGVTRILDLIVLLLLATVILMPRPDATVKPALAVDPELRGARRRAAVGADRPTRRRRRGGRARQHLSGRTSARTGRSPRCGAAQRFHPSDYRLYHLRAIAFADRFEGEPASEAAARALSLCQQTPPRRGGLRPGGGEPTGPARVDAGRGREGGHEEAALPGEGPHLRAASPDLHPEAAEEAGAEAAEHRAGTERAVSLIE